MQSTPYEKDKVLYTFLEQYRILHIFKASEVPFFFFFSFRSFGSFLGIAYFNLQSYGENGNALDVRWKSPYLISLPLSISLESPVCSPLSLLQKRRYV